MPLLKPPVLVGILDAQAGRVHSPTGRVRACLADILNAYDRWRDEQDRPTPPGTGKLCCCGTGQDCPACLTGRCWECPDNPERERNDEPDIAGGWYCNNSNCDCREHEDDDD